VQPGGDNPDDAPLLLSIKHAGSLRSLLAAVERRAAQQPLTADEVAGTLESAVRLVRAPRLSAPAAQPTLLNSITSSSDISSSINGTTAIDTSSRRARAAVLEQLSALLLPRFHQLGADAFAESDLVLVVYCCAKLHQQRVAGDWRAAALAAAGALESSLGQANMVELTRLIWALAALRAQPSAEWLDAFARVSQAWFSTAQPVQLALSAWGLARLRYTPPAPWIAALVEDSEQQLGAAEPQALANITWALGVWRCAADDADEGW